MNRGLLVTVCVAVGSAVLGAPVADPEPLVSLLISKVTAERMDDYTLIACEATLDNATGRDLTVRSAFDSAFDGIEVVVTNAEGKVLAQQQYTDHKSAFKLDGRDFPVKQGKTVQKMGFPVSGLPKGTRTLRVRLVGTLPGSSYKRILSSETMEVGVKKGTGE